MARATTRKVAEANFDPETTTPLDIRDVWNPQDGAERNKELAVQLADQYVEAHPEQFNDLRDKDLAGCITALEAFRSAGMESEEWKVQTWIFHKFEFQHIGAGAHVQVRGVNDGA